MSTFTLSPTKSIANDLRLTPQARKVLAHLNSGKTLSTLEAQNVYGVHRLAARINEIREIGYRVSTERKRDEMGQPYGRYSLT